MSELKHTPGPWKATEHQTLRDGLYTFGVTAPEDCSSVAQIFCRTRNSELLDKGNALLIAAAPDLLEALRGVLRVADRKTVEFDAARAAIAKATGQTPETAR